MYRSPRTKSPRPPALTWGLALLVGLGFMAGCLVPSQAVYVDAYLDQARQGPLLPGATYFVVIDPKAENPLLEREMAAKLGAVLNAKAYWSASQEVAEIILTFDFSQKSQMVSEEEPIYTPDRRTKVVVKDSQGNETTEWVTVPGVTRYRTVAREVFRRKLTIKAYQGRLWREGAGNQAVIWVGEASSESRNHDSRGALDYLIAGVLSSFGQDTGGSLFIRVSDEDPGMMAIRGQNQLQ